MEQPMTSTQAIILIGVALLVAAIAIGTMTVLELRTERASGRLAQAAAARDVGKRAKRRSGEMPWADRHVAEAGIDVTGRAWFGGLAAACAACALIVHGVLAAVPVTLMAVLAVIAVSELFLRFRRRARARSFEEQLARALPQIAQNLRAGVTPERAVRSVADNSPEPLATELRRVSAEASITADLATAFDALAQRTGSKDVLMVATAVRIVKTQGGSLSDILESVAETVESRQEMVRYAASQTASTKATAVVLIVMTAGLAIIQGFMQDGFLEFYRDNWVGWVILGAVAFLEVAGYAAICKISDVKVD